VKYHHDFESSGESFDDKFGEPSKFDAALGRVVLAFSYLEDSVRNVICLMLEPTDPSVGHIVSAGAGFRHRLDMMASLVRRAALRLPATEKDEIFDEWFDELLIVCTRAEELRNSYVHSSYVGDVRVRMTARAKRGLHTTMERASADLVAEVADYIAEIGFEVEKLPLMMGVANAIHTTGQTIDYTLADGKVATFAFGDLPPGPGG
jgi:hypothetical protein